MNTITKGDIGVLKVTLRGIEKGFTVSKPCGEGTRYDLIIDDGKVLSRVQVKYCDAFKDGAYHLKLLRHSGGYTRRLYAYTSNEIDALVVYLPETQAFAWLPGELWDGKSSVSLRLTPSKNGQKKNIVLLADYLW